MGDSGRAGAGGGTGSDHRWWAFTAVQCGNFVVYMDGFIVTLALPAMAREFDVGIQAIKWAVVAYLGALTVTLLVAGRVSDLVGRRQVTVVGIALHTLSAGLCALSSTLGALLVFRVLQGLGGALVLANVMAEITAVFPPPERRLAMAVTTSVLAVAQVTGLVVGGALIGALGWRAIFLIPVAVGAIGLGLDVSALPGRAGHASLGAMDWGGALLSILVVGAPFLFLERMSIGLHDLGGLGLIPAGALLLAAFIAMEGRSSHPLLDLSLFRSRAFVCGSAASACYFMAAVSCYFLIPLYAQVILGLSPFAAGLLVLPMSAALTISSLVTSRLARGLSARTIGTVGLVPVVVAMLGLSSLGLASSYGHVIWPVILLGIGSGMFNPPNNTAVLSAVPADTLGMANGLFTTSRNFGQAIGASLAAEILGHGLGPRGAVEVMSRVPGSVIDPAYLGAYVQAQGVAFHWAAGLALAGIALSALRGQDVRAAPPVRGPLRSPPPRWGGAQGV